MAGFLFAAIVLRIRHSDRMLQMIEALDNLNEGDRNGFINAAAISLHLSPGPLSTMDGHKNSLTSLI